MRQFAATWMKTAVVAVIVAGALATSGCSNEGFTWVDGDRYRFLGIEARCAPDGSPVLWQRANDDRRVRLGSGLLCKLPRRAMRDLD